MYTFDGKHVPSLEAIPEDCQILLLSEKPYEGRQPSPARDEAEMCTTVAVPERLHYGAVKTLKGNMF